MLKRSTSLVLALLAVVALVSTVTLLEVRAASSFATSDTQIFHYDLGYLQAPAGTESDIAPGYYWERITAVQGEPTAYVEIISYSGTVVSAGPVSATHQYGASGYASDERMSLAAMAATATASPVSPAPSAPASPSPSPSVSPAPSPSTPPPSPPSSRPGSIMISDTGVSISYSDGRITGTITFPWKGRPTGSIMIGWRF